MKESLILGKLGMAQRDILKLSVIDLNGLKGLSKG